LRTRIRPGGCAGVLHPQRQDQLERHGGADRVGVAAGSRSIEHLGAAHDDAELAALKAAAAERLTAGQAVLDLGVASIEAHLSIVVAALAVSHRVDHQTSWSIKKFVRTARRYRTVKIKAGNQMLTADPHRGCALV
jgi:hypothetical protein